MSVGLAIAAMERTSTLHPPGGATALFAVIGPPRIRDMGFLFVIFPCLLGSLLVLLVALIFNNLAEDRSYPKVWAFPEIYAVVNWVRNRLESRRRRKSGQNGARPVGIA